MIDTLLREHEPLTPWTGFRTGGTARWLSVPTDAEQLRSVLRWKEREGVPCFILGGGTNTLVGDETFDGLVISTVGLRGRAFLDDGRLEADPGTSLRTLIGAAVRAGWAGLEGFVGIPGTIGGAVWGNAGGAAGGIAPLVESVQLIEPGADPFWVSGDELQWRYRHSGIGDRTIARIRLRLRPGADPRDLRAVASEVFARKRETQPLRAQSAGCVFRNPPGDSAGRLIEAAGLKGASLGGARVSEQHANFIVNSGAATSRDIESLISRVRHLVADRFGVWLEREVISATEGGCRP